MTIQPKTTYSFVTRPYLISVEADIPRGARVEVLIDGILPGSLQWQKRYVNPRQEVLTAPNFQFKAIQITPPPNSIATPFLYEIVVEGDNRKHTFTAEILAPVLDMSVGGLVLMKQDDGKSYITKRMFPGAKVSKSDVTRPWMIEIVGHAPDDAQIIVPMAAKQADGLSWEKNVIGPCVEPLPFTFSSDLTFMWRFPALIPTSDGTGTPFFYGIAVMGDERRFSIPIKTLFSGGEVPEEYVYIENSETDEVLFLRPQMPEHFGFPTALMRLGDLFQQGKLRPE
jgi:hypothetical protein